MASPGHRRPHSSQLVLRLCISNGDYSCSIPKPFRAAASFINSSHLFIFHANRTPVFRRCVNITCVPFMLYSHTAISQQWYQQTDLRETASNYKYGKIRIKCKQLILQLHRRRLSIPVRIQTDFGVVTQCSNNP